MASTPTRSPSRRSKCRRCDALTPRHRGAWSPISTMKKPMQSIDLKTKEKVEAHYERSDVCVVPAAGVIGEAVVALTLADAFLEKFGGDSMTELERNYRSYMESIAH